MDHARVARRIGKGRKRFAPIYPASIWGLLPRAIMDIRPLLSSITRRPREGPWSRTRLQKCRWNRFSIRPFRLANLGGLLCLLIRPWIFLPGPVSHAVRPKRLASYSWPFASMLQAMRASFAAKATTKTLEWSRLDAASNQAPKPCRGQLLRCRSTALAP